MTLPQAAWSRTFKARPSQVFNASVRRGNTVRIRKLSLDLIAYETGGFPLNFANTQLAKVFDVAHLVGFDPDHKPIAAPAVYPVVTFNGAGDATLKLYNNGAEVANAWVGAAGTYIWLSFTGIT